MNMKTQSTSKHLFDEWKSIYIKLPFFLQECLSADCSIRKDGRFCKMKAFHFLVYHTPGALGDYQTLVNICYLTRKWKWSRWTVSKFIDELNNIGAVCIKKNDTEKNVSVNPSALQREDSRKTGFNVLEMIFSSLRPPPFTIFFI